MTGAARTESDLEDVVTMSTRSASACSLVHSFTHSLTRSLIRPLARVRRALDLRVRDPPFSSLPSLRRPTFAEKQDSRAVPRNEDEARKRERTPLFCKGEPLCGTRSDTRDTFSSLLFVHFIQDCGCQEERKNRTGGRREEEKEEEGSRVWRKRIIPSCEISSCGVGRAVSDSSPFEEKRIRGSERSNCRWTKLSLQVVVPSTTANLRWTRPSLLPPRFVSSID